MLVYCRLCLGDSSYMDCQLCHHLFEGLLTLSSSLWIVIPYDLGYLPVWTRTGSTLVCALSFILLAVFAEDILGAVCIQDALECIQDALCEHTYYVFSIMFGSDIRASLFIS